MPYRLLLLACLVAVLIALASSGDQAPLQAAEPKIEMHKDVVYGVGNGQDLMLDIARPRGASGPLPAVLVLHGGGWVSGNKRDVLPIVELLAEEGFVGITAQYRLARGLRGRNRAPAPWPAQIEDVKCAIRYLRANAVTWSIDPQRIAAMGFSAGAHLSMLLGTMDPKDGCHGKGGCEAESSKVQAVISFFGPTDMGIKLPPLAERSKLSREDQIRGLKALALSAILGPAFLADPSKASPLTYVDKSDAPMLLFQGTRDTLVSPENTYLMMNALNKAGVDGKVVFHIGEGHGTGWRSDPVATDAMQDVLDFLNQQLRPTTIRSLADRLRAPRRK